MTLDDLKCQIPFSYNNITENYFCIEQSSSSNWQCNTTSNTLSDCSLGKFLVFDRIARRPYTAQVNLKQTIRLIQNAQYVVRFDYYFNNQNCADMTFQIGLDPSLGFNEFIFDSVNDTSFRSDQPKWKVKEFYLQVGIDDDFKVSYFNIKIGFTRLSYT